MKAMDFTSPVPEDLFFDAHEGAVAGMAKRDPTAYSVLMDDGEIRFTDHPMNHFTFSLLAWLEKQDCIDRFYQISSRYDLLYRVVRSGKLGPHLTYRDGGQVAIHRSAFNVAARFPIVRQTFKRKPFIAAVETEFSKIEPACSRCKLGIAEHENGLCDECFLRLKVEVVGELSSHSRKRVGKG